MSINAHVDDYGQSETANAYAFNAYASTESQDSPALLQGTGGSALALEAGQTRADTSIIPEGNSEDATPLNGEDVENAIDDYDSTIIYTEWRLQGRQKCRTCKKRHPPPCRYATSVPKRQLDEDADDEPEPSAPAKRQRKAKQPSRREAGLPKLWCRDCEAEHPWPDETGSHHIRTAAESRRIRNFQRQNLAPVIDPSAFGMNAPLQAPPAGPQPAAPVRAKQRIPAANPRSPQLSLEQHVVLQLHEQESRNRLAVYSQALRFIDNHEDRMRLFRSYLASTRDPSSYIAALNRRPAPAHLTGPSYISAAALPGPGHTSGQTLQFPQPTRAPQAHRGRGRGGRGNGFRGGGANSINLHNAGQSQPNAPGTDTQAPAGSNQPSSANDRRTNIAASSRPCGLGRGRGAARR